MQDIVKCANRNCGLITNISAWRLVPDKENPRVTHQHCPRCDGESFYESKPGETEKAKSGAQLITLERLRQTKIIGWTPEHDDTHDNEELIQAAACYMAASAEFVTNMEHIVWPWPDGWQPSTKIRNLTKAGALLAAEIDRLQRVASVQNAPHEPRRE
jgi:hypothetical protein